MARGEALDDTVIAFVAQGLLKAYFPDEGGKETIKAFVCEQEVVVPENYFPGYVPGPEEMRVEALEPSLVVTLPVAQMRALYERHACWDRVGRILAESAFLKKIYRERELLLQSAADRYASFLATYPKLRGRVPQYAIAAYLGITPVALSRILKK